MRPEQIENLRLWAEKIVKSRLPDVMIPGPHSGYLLRWIISCRDQESCVYVHHIVEADTADLMHDHPWRNASVILSGRMIEHTPERAFIRSPGDVIIREPQDAHRMELNPGESCLTLFATGSMVDYVRDWIDDVVRLEDL